MSSSAILRYRRGAALALAAATAVMGLTAPASSETHASPWAQHSADAKNSLRGTATGPEDPGLKWLVDLSELETVDAPEGYSIGNATERFGDLNRPILAPDGTLIVRAGNDAVEGRDGGSELVGIDPDDGAIAWTIPFAALNCGQAIDAQDRLWTGLRNGEIAAFDLTTGEEIEGTRFEPELPCNDQALHIGGDPEHLLLFRQWSDESQIEAVDISGDEPEQAWLLELHEDDAPFDYLLHGSRDFRRAALSGDTAHVVGVTKGETEDDEPKAELIELSLADGSATERVELPTFDGSVRDLGSARLVRVDDTLVVGVEVRSGGDGDGYLAAYDAADDLEQRWIARTQDAQGPTVVTAGDGVVHANAGDGVATAYRLSDGEPRWTVEVAELGGSVSYRAVTDAEGRLFTHTVVGDRISDHAITAIDTDGTIEWQVTRTVIRQEAGREDEPLPGGSLYLGPIDEDGTLYAFREEAFIAIDDSGGLAACELPFEDVDPETNVHAANICRLVQAGITAGIDEDNYGPRLPVTRQQMATFLTRTLGLTPRDGDEFEDVNPNSVHAPNIYAIKDAGITAGVSATRFDPGGRLPRDQMATFLARAAELAPVDGSGFDDVPRGNVHRENIYAVRDANITQGVSPTRFAPEREVMRDQMASFLMRLVDYLDEQG
jgi:hypothetical protein